MITKIAGLVKKAVNWIWNSIIIDGVRDFFTWCLYQAKNPGGVIVTAILVTIILLLDGALALKYIIAYALGANVLLFFIKFCFPNLFYEKENGNEYLER